MFPGANAFRKLFRRTAAAEGVAAAVRPRVRMQVEEIEPRILYSADLAPGLVTDAGPAPVQMRVVAPVTTQSTDTQETRRHELVVVDTATQDYQFLVDDIVANAGPERRFDVLLIDAGRDGIAEVTGALASMQDIDAVHVISHGSDGVVRLGSAVLDAQVLEERGDEIARWAASLTANADLLIYGCDVAASVQGQALADGLAALTGADVAASEDPTGSAARGGDWELEYGAGAVETLVALSPLVQAQWQGLLATDVVIHQYDTALGGLDDSELKSDQSWGQRFRHDSAGATYQVDKVAVVLSRASDAPAGQTVTVSLRSTFSGAVIASGTVSSNALSTSPAWVTIALNSSATLNDNQNYVIRVDGSNQKLYVGTDGSGNYSTGDLLDKSGAAQGGKDMAFRLIDTVPTAAPVLNGANNLTGTNEDSASNNGTLVSALIAGQVTLDPLLSTTGIAVTGVDNTNGQWQYTTDGTTWNAFGAVTETSSRLLAADANNAVRFVPNANWNGTVTNGLTFRAWDQTSGTDGGTADSSTTNLTFRDNFNINSYSNNDGTGTWSASWVDTDGSFNSGQIQITGNRLEFDGGAASSSTIYRDVNLSGATSAILTFDFSNSVDPGTLTLRISSNGGASYTTLENNFPAGSFAATADITAFASANTRIRFDVVGDPGLLGIGAGGPFRVDNLQIAYVQARSGGNTAFSTATASSSITVAAVNDAPAGAATTKTILEEGSHVFALADFGFTDASDTPANNFTAVRIATLPGAGALTLGGIAVTAGQSIAAADVTAGNLRFTPVAGANGTAYASFTFRVEDDGGTANGGVNVDTTARTFTFDVTSVNDAPQGTTATLATPEDVPLVLNAAAFGFTDPGDTPANSLAAVRIESLPGAGTLTLSGAAVAAGQTIAVADLNAGRLVFTSAANVSGAGYASFTFRVQDDGATANGGVDLDASARTLTIDVTARNDAPVGASNTLTTTEETPLVFSAAQFGFTDPNDAAPNAFAAVRISALPTAGALTLAGAAVTAGQSVTVADITAGRLVFTPGLNGAGAGYASFAFQVQDDGGTANGGTDLDPTARTMTIDVTNVNDAPLLSGANNLTAILEDAVANSGTLVSALLAGQANDPDASALSGIAVTAVDNTNGAWQYSTNAGASWNAFGFVATGHARLLAADANTYVRFVPNANWNGTVASGLTFRAWDQMIGANGGTAPTIANPVLLDTFSTVSYANQNGTGGWSTNWVDAGGSAAGGDIGVSGGALTIRTKNNADGPIYRQADLSHATSATLSFTYNNPLGAGDGGSIVLEISGDGGGSYTTLATFSDAANVGPGAFSRNVSAFIAANTRIQFRVVSDSIPNRTFSVDNVQIAYTAAGNGAATAFSTATASAGITVTAVNDAPAGANNTVTAAEDAAFIFSAAHFGFSDSADAPANALAAVRVDALPGVGALTLSGAAVGAGQSIAIADIAAGRLAFTAAANANGAGYASFTFRVQDDGGTANGGVNLDPTARTMTINVTAVNDAPTGTTVTLATLEDTPVVLNAAAFGFTDTADTPANNLRAVRIATLPSAGALTLNGAAVIAGQSISAVDLAAGNLVFTPGANANGASHASFTFQVQDDGGTANGGIDLDPVARTMTIDVTPVNDAAVGANRTVTALEDTAFVFDVAAFGLIDAADAPANALAAVRISSLPAAGSLTLNGAAVNAGDTVTAADIAAGRLAFTPGAQANGAGYASFTFQVQDDGGTANGGADLDPVARTMTIDVTAVNDAPVGTSTTAAGFENAPLTLTAANFGFTDPSDTPAHSLGAVRITSLPTAGTLRLSGVGVTAGQTISAADIGAGNLVFTPAADANGNAYATLTFQVQDSGGTLNGGADLDAVARTLTIDLAPVNSAPVGTNATVSVFEDTSFALSAAHFGFTDPNDTAPNNLAAVTISAVPTAGSLILSGVAVTAGQSIALADINAGNLRFLAAADAAGTAYASFGFRVQDDGGTANGGVDLDTTARTITFDVTNVNDAPTGADRTVTALEDTAFVFDLAAFALTDPADAVANNLAAVRIAAVPTSGSLTLNGVAVNAGDFVTAADIVAGRLAFTPGADAAGAGYASFTFQVQDDGGTVNGGIDLDAVARTMTIDVTAVNDAPAGTSGTVTAVENAPFVFTAAAFGFTDPADAPGHNLSAVTVSALPALGTLTLSGVAVTAGQSIAIADIDAGNLAFTPAAHANGAGYTSFTFQVQDDGGAANGGVNLDATARTLTIDVTPANSAPVGTANTVVTLEDTPLPLTLAHFGFTDPNDTPANLPVAVTISSLPTAGTLALSGVALTAGQSITVADIAAGNLVYTPGANGAGAAYATFTFRVQDDGGTANGGIDLDTIGRTLTIDVTPVNDAPVAADRTVSAFEDLPFAFDVASFGMTDPVDGGAHGLASVTVLTLPGAGTLSLSGVAVTAGQMIAAADIAAGNLVFTAAADATGTGYAAFTFQVQDDGGVVNGGIDLDPAVHTMTIDVAAVNDAPAGTDNTIATFENAQLVLGRAAFGFSDPRDGPANNFAAVTVSSLPAAGTLTLNGVTVTAAQSVAVADIDAGRLVFTPTADANGLAYASFTFQVQDDAGTANGGVDLDATARTLTIDVTPTNSAPVGTNVTLVTLEETPLALDATAFGFTDPKDGTANNFAAVTITTLPTTGTLTLSGVAVTAGQSVAAADIAAGNLVYAPGLNGAGAGYATFTFRVQDDGGTANGGVDLDAIARTLTIDVTNVNDAPAGTANTVVAVEDVPFAFDAAAFGLTDAADAPGNNLAAVRITSLPAAGTLTLNGVAVNAGDLVSIADITAGNLAFTGAANAHGTGYTSFTFQVQDDGGTANGGVDLDPVARTMTIDVLSSNDAPSAANTTVTALEDMPFTFALADFAFTDLNDTPANNIAAVVIDTLPNAGSLTLNGVAIAPGQTVSAADIAAGRLTFMAAANANGAGYATFSFRVQDDGGTANGGAAVDPVARMMTIDVASVNDAPRSFFRTVTQLEDTPYAFQTSDFIVADASDSPANALFAVRIASLPTAGSLTLNGAAVAVGDFISVADIAAGNFTFTPALNAFGNNHARFTFQVQDDGGTANGGVNLDAIARTLQMNVTRVSDAPVGTSGSVTAIEDTIFTFTAAAFGFTDAADSPSHVFQALHITSLPTLGALTLNGVALTAGDVVSIADIDAGALRFAAAADGAGAAYASFAFRVEDSGGTANGGLDVDTMDRTMTINVTPVNDRPAGTNATVRTAEDTPLTLNAAMFGFTDPRDTPADTLKAVRITSLPTQGSLTLSGVAVTVGQTVQAADIAAGRLVFTAPADVAGQPFATFTFRVQDDGGTANAGADIDLTPNTLTVVVDAVNDAPSGRDNIVSTLVNVAVTIDVGAFGFYDPIDPVADAFIAVQMVTVPSTGSLTLSGVAVQAGQVVSTADIAAGRLTYTPARDAVGPAGFTFKVQDSGGTADGGVDLALVARTLTVDVRAPVITAVEVQAPVANTAPPAETRAPSSTPAPAAGASESPQAPREAAATATPPVAPEPEIPAAVGATTDAGAVATRSVQVNVQRAEFQPPNRETRTTIPTTLASEIQSLVLLSERSETQSESSGVLTSSQSRAARADIAPAAAARQMTEQMDQMRDGLRHETRIESGTIAATAATSLGLSVGYVIWVLRGGVLLSTLVSSLPAWRLVDPLPVLGRMDAEDDGEGDDSLESLVDGGEEPADPDARKSADDAEGVQA